MLILALVLGLFFVLLARDKMGAITDWRAINNATVAATDMPDNSKRDVNSTVLQTIGDLIPGHRLAASHSWTDQL